MVAKSSSELYRERKRVYARTPDQRVKRTEYMRLYRERHREKTNEQARESHGRKRRERTPEQRHAQHIWFTYGLTKEQFEAQLRAQGGGCAICGSKTPRGPKNWHVDHCHETGKLRGLLCNYCNPRLGWFETYFGKAMSYLQTSRFSGS